MKEPVELFKSQIQYTCFSLVLWMKHFPLCMIILSAVVTIIKGANKSLLCVFLFFMSILYLGCYLQALIEQIQQTNT
jgi:hypothetical protein